MSTTQTPGAALAAAAAPAQPHHFGRPGHEVSFNLNQVDPPSVLYVTPDDQILVTLAGLTTAAVFLEVRFLLANGVIVTEEEQLTGPNTRTPTSKAFRLTEGYILSASLSVQPPGVARGTLFAMLSIQRSQAPAPVYVYTLASGYISLLSSIAWPGLRADTSTAGGGFLESVTVANPAAGSDWTYTVAAGTRERIVSVTATLTTSATVANRIPVITITQGGNIVYQASPTAAQTATTALTYLFTSGLQPWTGAGGQIVVPLPPNLFLTGGNTISVTTTALQAGDQWSNIRISHELWMDV